MNLWVRAIDAKTVFLAEFVQESALSILLFNALKVKLLKKDKLQSSSCSAPIFWLRGLVEPTLSNWIGGGNVEARNNLIARTVGGGRE